MATDKNIIKNWFRNGLKPTQEQFWAWQDSYFHKSEKIPQQQIEGLADSLSNKADASQLNGKADLVDGKVPESQLPLLKDNTKVDKPTIDGNWVVNKTEDVISWVSADSFGKNMANSQLVTTVGAGVTQGANYTWDTAGYYLYFKGLPEKSNDNTFNKMVVRDSNGQIAEGDGKVVLENLFFQIESVRQKDSNGRLLTSYDEEYNEYLVFNPLTKKIAKSDRPQIISNVNIPSNITVTVKDSINNLTITPKPTYSQDLIDALNFIKNIESLGFTFFVESDFSKFYIADNELPTAILNDSDRKERIQNFFKFIKDGVLRVSTGSSTHNYNELYDPTYVDWAKLNNKKSVGNLQLNKALPSDKDWCIKFELYYRQENVHTYGHTKRAPNVKLGFSKTLINNNDYILGNKTIFSQSEWYGFRHKFFNDEGNPIYDQTTNTTTIAYVLKKGAYLILFLKNYNSGQYTIDIRDYTEDFKYMYFYLPTYRDTEGIEAGFVDFINLSYWIQP